MGAALGWKLGTLSGRLKGPAAARPVGHRGFRPESWWPVWPACGGDAAISPAWMPSRPWPDRLTFRWNFKPFRTPAGRRRSDITKLLTAAAAPVGIHAGTATTLISLATAQKRRNPQRKTWGAAGPHPVKGQFGREAMVGGGGTIASAAWEYKVVPREGDSLEAFERILREHAAAGWEYCGTEALSVTDPDRRGEWGTSPTIVFKRPKGAHGLATSGAHGAMTGMGSTFGGMMSPGGMGMGGMSGKGLAARVASGGGSRLTDGQSGHERSRASTGAGMRTSAFGSSGGPMAPMGGGTMGPGRRRKTPLTRS